MTSTHERLKRWFESTGLSKVACGELLSCSGAFVGLMLDGKRLPGLPTALAIERATAEWPEGQITVEEWAPHYEEARRPAEKLAPTGTDEG